MNASDIRLLAERAEALADRSLDRLDALHERVAAVRRRRRVTAVVVAAAAVLVVLLASIALVSVDPTERTPDPAPTPTLQPAAEAPRPAEGTCWAVPPDKVVDFRKDGSPQVPCTEAHTTETVVVLNLDEPTAADAEQVAVEMCWEHVRNYLGIDGDSWVPYTWVAFLPSQEQIDDGASWVRCDAVFTTSLGWPGPRAVTRSALGAADNPWPAVWACFDEPPVIDKTRMVPCDRPHAYEETGRLATTFGLTEYPTEQQRAEAEANCGKGIPPWLSGLEIDASWMPRSAFVPGLNLDAICYVHDPEGGMLPAVRPTQLEGGTS